jgi:hypothetical protein
MASKTRIRFYPASHAEASQPFQTFETRADQTEEKGGWGMSKFDSIRDLQTEAEERAAPRFERTIGCPQCHQCTGSLLVGRQTVEYCSEHRVYWLTHLNPWSPPFAELDAEQRQAWSDAGLENFTLVQPWVFGAAGSSPLVGRTLREISEMAEKQKSKS